MRSPSLLMKSYFFVKRHRFRKKKKLYAQAFRMMVDKTIAIYLFVMVGYFLSAVFIFGDTLEHYIPLFKQIEQTAEGRWGMLVTALPTVYILRASKEPGILFTSSEYQLSLLPYRRLHIWYLCALEKIVKKTLIIVMVGLFVVFVTPLRPSLIVLYVLLLIFIDVWMTIPQWKLFQQTFFVKCFVFVCLLLINIIHVFYYPSEIFLIMAIGVLMLINVFLFRRLPHHIAWDRVTEVSDFATWNMFLISQVTGVKFKRQKKFGMIQKLAFPTRPFRYNHVAIHHRLWQLYFSKNIDIITKIIGSLLLLLVALFFVKSFVYFIGVAVAIHIYTTAAASFYHHRFSSDVLGVLPWELATYKRTFFKWVIYGFFVLLVPMTIFLGLHATIWTPIQGLLFISTFFYAYHVKLNKMNALLGKQNKNFFKQEAIQLGSLIIVAFTGVYPALSLFSFVLLVLLVRLTKSSDLAVASREQP